MNHQKIAQDFKLCCKSGKILAESGHTLSWEMTKGRYLKSW